MVVFLIILILLIQIIILTNVYSMAKYIVPMRDIIKGCHHEALLKLSKFRTKKSMNSKPKNIKIIDD